MMKRIQLNGGYKLKYFEHGETIDFIFEDSFIPDGWLDTKVPEDVRTVLRRYGFISGHYYGKDVDKERWIDEKDWVYYRNFFVSDELEGKKNTIIFEGIDTLAEVYVNGVLVGNCENMHISYEFDVSEMLRYGKRNYLVIRVLSPVKTIENVDRTGLYPEEDTDRLLLRKPQMNYGWDFCGHCLTTGIWKSVTLFSVDHDIIEDVFVHTVSLDRDRAYLNIKIGMSCYEGYDNSNDMMTIELIYDGDVVFAQTDRPKFFADLDIAIEDPKLWWPRPYGEPCLYQMRIVLQNGAEIVDEKKIQFGIRTVELLQEPLEEEGRSFIIKVNGKRIFVRGANWVPINCVYGEIKDEEYEFYIRRAVDANLSMLRIWGGGIYEPDIFFDLCDREGIMVFQDFMLACGIFPQDEKFLDLVYEEAKQIIKKYRNRASLVLWSGDNEVDQAYWWYDKQEYFKDNKINRIAIQQAIEEEDPTRPFLISSPCSPFEEEEGGDDPNSPIQGDMHIYLNRFDEKGEYYYKELLDFVPRFMSEYGFSSLPSKDTFDKFNFFKGELDIHRNPWLGKVNALAKLADEHEYDELIYGTQYTHAQGLKYWIEYMRSHKWTCAGTLYWKFNDPIAPNRPNMIFPTMMSSIDFYGTTKLSYYYTRRAYEDIILAFRESKDGRVEVVACNETDFEYNGVLTVEILDYYGNSTLLEESDCYILKDASTVLTEILPISYEEFSGRNHYIKVTFASNNLELENRYWLVDIEESLETRLPRAELRVEIQGRCEDEMVLSIYSDIFVRDVTLDILDVDAFYSDNCFDLDAMGKKTVTITSNEWHERRLRIKARNSDATVIDLDS